MANVASVVMRADEVLGAGKHVWKLHREAGAASTFLKSLDDIARASVPGANPGQPIGVFRHARGIELVPLDARFKGAAMVTPRNYPPIGGLTLRVESVHALDDSLLGMTHLTSQGRMGRFYEQGVVPNSALWG